MHGVVTPSEDRRTTPTKEHIKQESQQVNHKQQSHNSPQQQQQGLNNFTPPDSDTARKCVPTPTPHK